MKNFESEKFDEVKRSEAFGERRYNGQWHRERENLKLIGVCVEIKSKNLENGQFDVQVIGKIL